MPGMEGQFLLNPTEHLLSATADGAANVPSGDSSAYLVALAFALLLGSLTVHLHILRALQT